MMRVMGRFRLQMGLWRDALHHTSILDFARRRTFVVGTVIAALYGLIGIRLVDVMVFSNADSKKYQHIHQQTDREYRRQDIVDCNGEVLATQIVTASVCVNPKIILNAADVAQKLVSVFPDMDVKSLTERLSNRNRSFVWIARHVPPKLQQAVHQLGIPGVFLQKDYKRVYPYGSLCSHIIGRCDIDMQGISGVELKHDDQLKGSRQNPLRLSIDMRVQSAVAEVLAAAIEEFGAIGGNVMIMRISDGQMVSMVSLPTFDPNAAPSADEPLERNVACVAEPGSTFKILTSVIALESGKAHLGTVVDARFPIKIGRNTVTDFRIDSRMLTLAETFVLSSNIGSIQLSRLFGSKTQLDFFRRFGVFDPISLELPEKTLPLFPKKWSEVTTWTSSYGYGVAVAPLRTLALISSIVSDGRPIEPTLLYCDANQSAKRAAYFSSRRPFISQQTSFQIRRLMRAQVQLKSKKANIEGYQVLGKTGTSYKRQGRSGYGAIKKRRTSFIGAFPGHKPQYVIMVMLDEPNPTKETYGFATAGWNAAPTGGRIIERVASLLNVEKTYDKSEEKDPTSWLPTVYVNPKN